MRPHSFDPSHFLGRRPIVALAAALVLLAVPLNWAGAAVFQQDDTFTELSGSPNPQATGLPVTITGSECDRSRDVMATGDIVVRDTTTNHTLGKIVLGPSTFENCGEGTLTASFAAPGKHVIRGTYVPGGQVPVARSTPADYTQTIRGRQHEHSSLHAMSDKPHFMKGGELFNHPMPKGGDHDQGGNLLHLPMGKLRLGPESQPSGIFMPGIAGGRIRRAATINLSVNTANAVPSNNDPSEPNEASDGNVVVYTTNEFVAFSVDGGATFHSFNPGSLYSDFPDGGVCCDQIVQYVPQINRFVWLDQYWGNLGGTSGKNRYRLAVFPPSAVTAGGLTSWTYWDITAASFPALTRPFLDFPDLAVGQNYLYLSANNGINGKVYTSVIARIGLNNLANGLNLAAGSEAWRYIAGPLFFGRVAQNTGSRAYWGQNINTSSLGVSYWDESSTSWYGPYTIGDYSWPNTNYSTTTPDGNSWLSTYTGTILAATRTGQSDLWLAWTAGIGSGNLSWLSQPNIQLVDIALPGLTLRSQRSIWNPGYAFAYPNLNTSTVGDLGIGMAWGGNGHWVNYAVGDLTRSSNLVWNMTGANASCACGRWGDYINIRPAYGQDRGGFAGAGYATVTNPTTGSGYVYDNHYVRFSVSP